GKELSYTNILDADAAWWLIQEFKKEPFACAILKHANPCGVAASENSLNDAFKKALACDSQSAFGGIVAFNRELDGGTAEACAKIFLEIILAPGFSKGARDILAKKKNLRLLETKETKGPEQLIRSAGGGLLIQDADRTMEKPNQWKTAVSRKPTPEETAALAFAWKIVKHVKSNAIVFAAEDRTLGIGAGQMSRIDAIKVATMKFNSRLMTHDSRLVAASDAFFPFPDNIEAIAQAGATAVIQPGGSIRDPEVIAEADRRNLAMVFTGVRHFRH
ncbi:MAG: bifunctional phosphoribosylaminoimidazolecarboxamide formyltransferase/IMP cyclohydrolase, partial [Deltaproteobacteria bacterium]|nr:bifunctional phosphoribosylaminoimidazolecarboxamide formyltransferase/IMP cyclohydrolase [Deltaproteobacteria bacterium]